MGILMSGPHSWVISVPEKDKEGAKTMRQLSFKGRSWKLLQGTFFTPQWPELSCMAISSCRGSWKMIFMLGSCVLGTTRNTELFRKMKMGIGSS